MMIDRGGGGVGWVACCDVQRQIARRSNQDDGCSGEGSGRIVAMATVEASAVVLEDDSEDVKAFLARLAVNWESSDATPLGGAISKTRAQLGVSQASKQAGSAAWPPPVCWRRGGPC